MADGPPADEGVTVPNMTKKLAIEISKAPEQHTLIELMSARARLGESLEKGTPGGYNEHRYVEGCAAALDKAIAAAEG